VTINTTGIPSITTAALEGTAALGRLVIVGVSPPSATLPLSIGQLMSVGFCIRLVTRNTQKLTSSLAWSGKVVMSSIEGDAMPREYVVLH
jgi:threonine dehydrogenase-like Zn-dependent dehydrogenase